MLEEYLGKRIIAVGEKADHQFPQLNIHYSGILLSASSGIVQLADRNSRLFIYHWTENHTFVGLDTRPFKYSKIIDITQPIIHFFPLDEAMLVRGLSEEGKGKYVFPLMKFLDWQLKKRE